MDKPIEVSTFEVEQNEWRNTRLKREQIDSELNENQVLLKVDRFALTANNISYCAAGDMLGYWRFFPATDGFGRVPTMGYANVFASSHPDIAVGERVYGFYPMSNYLVIDAGAVSASGFSDVSAHRADLAPIYARFNRVASNPFYDVKLEDYDLLLRGLYMTSWLVEDFMSDNNTFGASSYLITSASSKTSIALAHVVKARGEKNTIGITSEANLEFCTQLGCYDELVTYEHLLELDNTKPVVLVDMAGNTSVLKKLHEHFSDNMKYSCKVGATHFEEASGDVSDMPGAKPEFFFAPGRAQKRTADWGPGEVEKRIGGSLQDFQTFASQWLNISRGQGAQDIEQRFKKLLSGGASPSEGIILSM